MKYTTLFFIILINTISYSQSSVEEDWILHFPPVLDYENYYIYKMAKDNQGNLFLISQKNFGGGVYKYVVIKIILNNWIIEWVADFEEVGYDYLGATDLAVDNEGNVYVAGMGRQTGNSNNNYITAKYNPSGEQLWVATYDGAMNSDDWINDLCLDNSGNVYVTGASHEFSQFYWDATTIKYNQNGIMQWKNTYIDSNDADEEGKALIADYSGNVYVASRTFTTSIQYLTIKYNSTGVEEWLRIDGTGEHDYADFIGLDNSGKIIVGGTVINPTQGPLSYLMYKFNPDGTYAAGNSYNSYSYMRGMVVSPQGNIFVTGDPGSNFDPPHDIVTVKYNSSLNFQWAKHFNYAGVEYASELALDQNENIFVTGVSILPSVQTYAVTVKYNTNGDSLWANLYTHQNYQNNSASRIVLDESGNSFVTINYYDGSTQGQEIIKLNNSGVYQWSYNYKTFCQPTSVKEDTKGNIYLTGSGGFNQSMWDYITMKCDSSGNIIWIKTYDGPANGTDQASDLEIDHLGNVYVTGGSIGLGTDYDFTTVKYDSSGIEQWVVRYNGPAFGSDIAGFMRVDQNGNVYVSGSSINSNSTFDIATLKYNNLGQLQWVNRYNGTADGNDLSQGLEVDLSGNVFLAGTSDSTGSLYDYVTVKYNPSGNTEWVKRYNGPANDGDLVSSMTLDNSGDVYVTGWSFGNGTQSDYATIKYNNSGIEQWAARWDDPASFYDYANDIAVDEDENVYVTGMSQGMGTDNDYTTVKYDSTGQQQWAVPYNGQTNGSDIANNIVLDYLGDIYVTGHSNNNVEYSTIKYDKQGVQKWGINFDYLNYQDTPTDLLVDNSGNVLVAGYSSLSGQEWIWNIVKYKQPGFVPSDVEIETVPPTEFVLYQNYPNPFNPTTSISFSIPSSAFTSLKVYDILGNEVATLVNEEKSTGSYEVKFDAPGLSSGIYFYKLQAGNIVETKKMLLIK